MKIAFAIFIILLGIIILFFNPGWGLMERIFENLSTAWPMIFIFLGLAILSQVRGLKWLRILNTILMILFIVYLVLWPDFLSFSNLNLYKSEIDLPIEAAKGSTIRLVFITGTLDLELNDGKTLTNLIGYYSFNSKYFEIISKEDEFTFHSSRSFTFGRKNKIKLDLPEGYDYEVIVKSGVSNLRFNLKKTTIKNLEVESGVTTLDVELRKLGSPTSMRIKSGIVNASVELPENAGYSLDLDGGIKNVKVSNLIEEVDHPDFVFTENSGILNLKLTGRK